MPYGAANPVLRTDPRGLDPWHGGEIGATVHVVVVGAGFSIGSLSNSRTGETCPYIQICYRIGLGFQGTVGAKLIPAVFCGPHCGKDLSGWSWNVTAEEAVGIGAGISIGRNDGDGFCGGGFGMGRGVGPSAGLGASVAVERCYMQVANNACKNTPCECKEPKPCDCSK